MKAKDYEAIQSMPWNDEAQQYAELEELQNEGLSREQIGKVLDSKQRL